jgi:hypothetical protein
MSRPRSHKKAAKTSWYLLIHQLPPEPLYLRAKVRQRLAQVGAVALKKSVYALPRRDDCLEDLQWIAEEAIAGGGEAHICEARFLEGRTEASLIEQSRAARNGDYEALLETLNAARHARSSEGAALLARARKRFEEIGRIDFFDAPLRKRTEAALGQLDAAERRARKASAGAPSGTLKSRTWATRRGIHIDRIASAWLIRRFIDPRAQFRFIDPGESRKPRELRFDMVDGDFSHEGDRCTFETLALRNRIDDKAIDRIGEIVHDIDLKDGKFGRPEAPGLETLVTGLVLSHADDEARLQRGLLLFDDLYHALRRKPQALRRT